MQQPIAIIGAGVSGLTCAVLFAEHDYPTTIFAEETGTRTTSAAAAAIWFPYDVEPMEIAIEWALESYKTFDDLGRKPDTGVSMIELRTFCRSGSMNIPSWASQLGATALNCSGSSYPSFCDGFALAVPLMDTTIYLKYLTDRFLAAGGRIVGNTRFNRLDEVSTDFRVMVNCSGIGARSLVPDHELESHRGQIVIVPKLDLAYAVVCDDAPLMYAIPRTNDTVLGGTNELSDNRRPEPGITAAIVEECSRVLGITCPEVLAERVGLRPFRRTGICLGTDRLGDGRMVIHNYGHGGAGFTLSWGCAEQVLRLATV